MAALLHAHHRSGLLCHARDQASEARLPAPRIDVSGGTRAIVEETLPGKVVTAIEDVMPVQTTRRTVLPYAFAWPDRVMHNGAVNTGCTEIMSPWSDAALEGDV